MVVTVKNGKCEELLLLICVVSCLLILGLKFCFLIFNVFALVLLVLIF